jgi:hypothetical protein
MTAAYYFSVQHHSSCSQQGQAFIPHSTLFYHERLGAGTAAFLFAPCKNQPHFLSLQFFFPLHRLTFILFLSKYLLKDLESDN